MSPASAAPPAQVVPPQAHAVQPVAQPPQPVRPPQAPPPVYQPAASQKRMNPLLIILGSFIMLLFVLVVSYFAYFRRFDNRIEIQDQRVGATVAFEKVQIGHPDGGMVVIQRKSSFTTGQRIANSGLIPSGTYIKAGIDVALPTDGTAEPPIVPGEYLYAVLYGESDNIPGLTPGDKQLKNLFGQFVIARFMAQ